MREVPLVSIIIPTRNEEKFIEKCLNSIIENDYPEKEIIVVDGMSDDNTRQLVEKYPVRVIDNPDKYTPQALNKGIRNATGKIIMIAGAHTIYSKNYISSCVRRIVEDKCDIAGGQVLTICRTNTSKSKAIAGILSHPFGIGGAKYRLQGNKEVFVDTVAYGLYKKELFEKAGLFNEKLIRNQDIEMNLRLKKLGARILLVPEAKAYYYARNNISSLVRNNFENGFWVLFGRKFAETPFSIRHLVPFFFVLFLISMIFMFSILKWLYLPVLILYVFLDFFSAIQIARNLKDVMSFFWLIILFPILHISYGIGSLCGALSFFLKPGK
ncbi:glycosyltransferase family 2 protein [Thermosipho atlanticus]|uniref:Glycosyltransferase, catalytic subunit of cellulose synthase and poly-beta-1,6-N-acetylglucosamine synthase n=1 Tax=Thermosipho atlanticus DSM 15807 TaxID=1123380 RepID=A0A1M5T3J2_9BACT|nr:glycosyltransferase family 2 protein [Thermosipho atlanticus]SHH44943.1 Glycosyltransferase, catalytic subunit of cellulose synthase and poly-beta-1,6-N-acetylglucosamine synthase [Thermosipho atlanticus DSM 15807]